MFFLLVSFCFSQHDWIATDESADEKSKEAYMRMLAEEEQYEKQLFYLLARVTDTH